MTGSSGIGVVGGGIVGLATARQLARSRPGTPVTVLEKEPEIGRHQTGHNSGVVHAGLYYAPGSAKARLCRRGGGLLRDYCAEHGIRYDELGKVVVARSASELAGLERIEQRALANGVPRLARLGAADLRGVEPHVAGVAALHSPTTAVADFPAVARNLAADVIAAGGSVHTSAAVTALRERGDGVDVRAGSQVLRFDFLVVCAGLQGDRVARMIGAGRDPAIVPFRGEYAEIVADRTHLIRGLVYPVPDPRYPFLGVHLTRHVHGQVLVGPNAVLALAREGYRWRDISPADLFATLSYPGSWRLFRRHWRTGVREMWGSLSRRAFLAEARTFVPELRAQDLRPSWSGVRAQAVDRRGTMVDDFAVQRQGRVVLVRNAPSPAATSSLAIAEHLVVRLGDDLAPD